MSDGRPRGLRLPAVWITVAGIIPGIHIVFDCADPDRLARFWMVALPGYDFPHGPPDGFAAWEQWADANEVPQEQRNAGRTLVDKQGHRPDIFFLRVPEGKAAEPRTGRRMHIDVMPTDGTRDEEVVRLKGSGATRVRGSSQAPTAPVG
ncbi:hypothetical protein GA0070624_1885 [Micromonospora rhizosphaerae]|uniref:Glyoxalase-like domain-containing protein n=1 Tax=Micromonospora rhizosphaerae TaxID=568872 RepID=A0A1C6RS20_9ACTN|nr:VOC family protein [Micromonospora rhizosphaerae]SCL19968.1 hypothetical protein GA0070624_1885 [Micromonospora rhizosphaerae]